MTQPPEVSVVVPLLNEAATVRELVERVEAALDSHGVGFEIICVDDGSTDGTPEALRALERSHPSLRVFELVRNFGQAAALACGLRESRGDVVVTMDGDLQNPPEEIPRLLDALGAGAYIASGRRGMRHEQTWRLIGSRLVHWLARALVRADIEDYGGQFKAYRREVVEAVKPLWGPGKPFFVLAVWLGFPVTEVEVRHDARRVGPSRYTLASLLRVNLDLVTSFTTLPLVVMGGLGVASFAAGTAGIVACAAAGVTHGLWPGLALVALVIGAVFAAAGALGVYLARVYGLLSTSGPGYVVRPASRERAPQRRRAAGAEAGGPR